MPDSPDATAALLDIWRDAVGDDDPLPAVRFTGAEPVLPSIFAVGTAAGASVAAAGAAAGALWHERGGPVPAVGVDLRHAAVAFRSERHLRVDGGSPGDLWAGLSGDYRTSDGGWVRLHCNFPHHAEAAVRALQCEAERQAVKAAVLAARAVDVEEAVTAEGGCAAMLRTRRQWMSSAPGQAVSVQPLVAITGFGPAPAERFEPAARPLSGVRVLDLTRVIAGPVCGRVLSLLGAEVLTVAAPDAAQMVPLLPDTGFGKRSCHIDLDQPDGRAALAALIAGADVLVQSYRPGSLESRGFGLHDLEELRPGLVQVDVSAYGSVGPWGGRRGFDSLVQMTSGLTAASMEAVGADRAVPLPAQALDHATGWLAAFGALTALRRRQREGGSWHIEVSLARTAAWLDELGRIDGIAAPDPGDDVDDLLATMDSGFGRLTYVRPPLSLDGTPLDWRSPPPLPGADSAAWAAPGAEQG